MIMFVARNDKSFLRSPKIQKEETRFLFSTAMLSRMKNISLLSMKGGNNTMINEGSREQLSLLYTNDSYSKSTKI